MYIYWSLSAAITNINDRIDDDSKNQKSIIIMFAVHLAKIIDATDEWAKSRVNEANESMTHRDYYCHNNNNYYYSTDINHTNEYLDVMLK